jgi:hypothetical protein
MSKKTMVLAMALGALLALAIPAMASASQLTSGGKALAVGTVVQATSSNAKTVVGETALTCTSVAVSGKLTKNTGGESVATTNGAGTTSGCKFGTTAATITDATLLGLTLVSPTVGTASLTFVADIGPLVCHFSSTSVAVTYTAGASSIHLAGTLIGSGSGCPTSGAFSGDFALETTAGVAVIVDK